LYVGILTERPSRLVVDLSSVDCSRTGVEYAESGLHPITFTSTAQSIVDGFSGKQIRIQQQSELEATRALKLPPINTAAAWRKQRSLS